MSQARPRTKPGRLSETARHVILPAGIVSTGWPAVRDKCASFGVSFDPWQDGAGRAILSKRADGSYACSIGGAVISIPRQVGKTFLIGAIVFALCLLFPGLTVLWTAHRLRTADETFAKMQAFANRRNVKSHIANIRLGSGDEEIVFHNGSRIMFGARERGFGRGFDDVDVEVFDEAQILTENAIDDMVPATNTAANPLLIFTGTPPKPKDPSEVFQQKREVALSGEDTDTLYIEFSAEYGCDPTDRKQWACANPSFPYRTPEASMLRMRKNLTPESFMREALGVWDPKFDASDWRLRWGSLADEGSMATDDTIRLCLDAPPDARSATFAIAGIRDDGLLHVSVRRHLPPTNPSSDEDEKRQPLKDRVIKYALRYTTGHHTPLILPPASQSNPGARIWRADLLAAGVQLDEMTFPEYAQARGRLIDAVNDGTLRHRDNPDMNAAVAGLVAKPTGDGEVWTHRLSGSSITPIVAATCALVRVPTSTAEPMIYVWQGGAKNGT
jgi:phage terminase large subunit-like protein